MYSGCWGCQGGTVRRGLSCRSRCWQIEFQLCQTDERFPPLIAGSFRSGPKLGGPVFHNAIVGTLKTHLCPPHIRQVLRLSGAVSLDMLYNALLRITLTVLEVVGTENRVTSNLPFLFDPSSITTDWQAIIIIIVIIIIIIMCAKMYVNVIF